MPTYEEYKKNNMLGHGLLTILNEVATGDLRDLIKDLGISSDTLNFYNTIDYQKQKDNYQSAPSDTQIPYLNKALFSPIDMTDYESAFVGFNEIGGSLPISGYTHLKPLMEDAWPQKDALMSLEVPEKRRI